MSVDALSVVWDGRSVGTLSREGSVYTTHYRFRYADLEAPQISVALPVREAAYEPDECRPFFEALLPEGTLREAIATRLSLGQTDSFGMLAELGRDCAGALQILAGQRLPEEPSVRWLSDDEVAQLIVDLPERPLGMTGDGRLRLSLAGVQRKAVLVRRADGRFGEPLDGAPSTHIVKPEPLETAFPGIAVNELFCMRLAAACGLPTADVEIVEIAGRRCLVITRFDRTVGEAPVRRTHQEDLCQAIRLVPGFKYASQERPRPSWRDLAQVLDHHGSQPGKDRLTAARLATFVFLTGNADAHGKNLAFLHDGFGRVRLAPCYDLVSTAAWPHLDATMAMSIGDEFDPDEISFVHFDDLSADLGLSRVPFRRECRRLVDRVTANAATLAGDARRDGWHHPVIDATLATIRRRAERVV